MPRRPRQESPAQTYHFINRGVNKKKIFHGAKDYDFYLGLLKEYCQKLNVQIYHYCIMSNHAHLIVKTEDLGSLSKFGHFTHRRYAYYYCKTYHWSEQVFRRNISSNAAGISKETLWMPSLWKTQRITHIQVTCSTRRVKKMPY
jgi:REP element-mobilizing transposase RayT